MNFDKRKSRGITATEASRCVCLWQALACVVDTQLPFSASREELLAKVTADRAIREASRRRLKAAIIIQTNFRSEILLLGLEQSQMSKSATPETVLARKIRHAGVGAPEAPSNAATLINGCRNTAMQRLTCLAFCLHWS